MSIIRNRKKAAIHRPISFGSPMSAMIIPTASSIFIFDGSFPHSSTSACAACAPVKKTTTAKRVIRSADRGDKNHKNMIQRRLPTVPGPYGKYPVNKLVAISL